MCSARVLISMLKKKKRLHHMTEIFIDHNIVITFSIKKDNQKCTLTPSDNSPKSCKIIFTKS